MAVHNIPASSTFEEWRVDYNTLSSEIGDVASGITGSVPAGTPSYTSIIQALEGVISDVDSIVDGTYDLSYGTDSSTSPTTGALVVSGGVGIGENLNVAGNIGFSGNLIDLTTGSPVIFADTGFSIAMSIALS